MAKPTIVTRASKGSALTWTEGDANFTNLKDATIAIKAGTGGTDVVSDLNGTVTLVAGTNISLSGDNTAKTVTINNTASSGIASLSADTNPTLGGNLKVNGYQITSVTNGNIVISPTGTGNIALTPATGKITLGALDFPTSMGTNGQVLTTNGSSAMTWTTVSSGATNLDGLSDVVITSAALGEVLYHNGTNWVDTSLSSLLASPSAIGGTAAAAGTFTQLTINGSSVNTSISPTGTGTVTISPAGALTINPAAASTINNTSIGATTASTGRFTTVQSTATTGTAPFTVASTTNVANLNASSLNGATFAAPGAIGSGTASTGAFTTLSASSTVTLSPASAAVAISPTGTGTVAISPAGALTINPTTASTINNTSIGATTASTGAFTTLSASSTVSGTGFSTYLASAPNIGSTTAVPFIRAVAITRNGNQSVTAWTTNGTGWRNDSATFTDTSSTGTVAASYINVFNTPTFASTNTITITDAANLYLADPAAGANSTLTNRWSLLAGGRIKASAIDATPVGSTTASTGAFTTLTASGGINSTTIGATTAAAGTFTNLTVTGTITSSAALSIKDLRETVYTAGATTGTITPDVGNGTVQKITLTGNITFNAFNNPVAGQSVTMILTQDATGSRTLTSTMKFAGGTKTLSTAANSIDIMTVFYDGSVYYASLAKAFA